MESLGKLLNQKIETDFINVVKITQVGEVDYIFHFYNTYSGKRWVFKVYKPLFDKGMEIRKKIELEITTSADEEEEGVKVNGSETDIFI